MTRITGCGDQNDFRILQSETNSRVITNLHLHTGSEASVSSYVTMNVVSVKQASRRFVMPNETVEIRDPKFKFTQKKEEKVSTIVTALTENIRGTDKMFSVHSKRRKQETQ